MIDFKLQGLNGDFSVRVNGPLHPEAEDVFRRLERGFYFEFSEESGFLFEEHNMDLLKAIQERKGTGLSSPIQFQALRQKRRYLTKLAPENFD